MKIDGADRLVSAAPDRPASFAAVGILATLNVRASGMLSELVNFGWSAAFLNLFSLSAVLWFALYGLLDIAESPREPDRMSRLDWTIVAILAGSALLPLPILTAGLELLAALWLWRTSSAGSDSRRIAFIMLAICGHLIVGPTLLRLFGKPLLELDSVFVAWLAGTQSVGNVVNFVDGTTFSVGESCSSLGNISLGILFWMTVVQLFKLPITMRLLGYLGLSVLTMFLVNTARLVAIALYPADFVVLHEGVGNAFFGWVALIWLAGIAAAGVLDAHRHTQ